MLRHIPHHQHKKRTLQHSYEEKEKKKPLTKQAKLHSTRIPRKINPASWHAAAYTTSSCRKTNLGVDKGQTRRKKLFHILTGNDGDDHSGQT